MPDVCGDSLLPRVTSYEAERSEVEAGQGTGAECLTDLGVQPSQPPA